MSDNLLTIPEVAQRLKVSESWVRDHITRKTPIIPHSRMGGVVRVRESSLDQFVRDLESVQSLTPRRKKKTKTAAA